MSIFGKGDSSATDMNYTKDMLDIISQKEAQKDFNDQVRRFKEFNGYSRHLTNEVINILRSQAIKFKLEEKDNFKLQRS